MIKKSLPELCFWVRQEILGGRRVDVESVLSMHPEILSSPDTVVDLIVTAFEAERERGDRPNLQFWLFRYHAYRDLLVRAFEARGYLTPTQGKMVHGGEFDEDSLPVVLQALPALPPHRIEREISRGGMGVVYEATDLTLQRRVALKVIRAGFIASPTERLRFYREARIAASLDHEHLLPVLHYGTWRGEDALTMPLMTGGSLQKWFAQRRGLRETIEVMRQVARGVAHLHHHGYIHRDLKLANVLRDGQGTCRIADFGLAWLSEAEPLTQTRQQLGTPGCMAPEQTLGQKVDARADVFALGVMLYEAFTGQRPFWGRTREELLRATRETVPLPMRRLRPDLPIELERLILRCLEKRPADRYADAGEVERELAAWSEGKPLTTPAAREPRLPQWFGALASMLLFVAALGLLTSVALMATPKKDPHAYVMSMLRRGKPVELIGPRGGPSWSRWLQQPDRPAPILRPRLPFMLSVDQPSALELLPSVPCPKYRLSANMRMILPQEGAQAGIYVMGSETSTPSGTEADLLALSFHHGGNRFRVEASIVSLPAPNPLGAYRARYLDNGCPLYPVVLRGLSVPVHTSGLLATVGALTPLVFGHKHHLEIDVSMEQVDLRLDGLPMGVWQRASDQKIHEFWWKHLQLLPRIEQRPAPIYRLSGSVGIYLQSGAVEITNLRITPLR
jgi:tRNA A-37 threonylcarbamoyl transferase component Bud32